MSRKLELTGYGIFVGREREIASLTSDLDRIFSGLKVNANLKEYYGSPGMGKSELLRQFEEIANREDVSHHYIDFATEDIDKIESDPSILFDKFAKSLIGRTDQRSYDTMRQMYLETKRPRNVVSGYAKMDQETRLYQRPKWLDAMRNQTVEMIKVANQLGTEGKPQVLILDNVQHVGVDTVDFIEEWMINPLIQVPGLIAMWADKRPWRWKRPEIRRRLNSNELKPLSIGEVTEWVNTVTEAVAPAQIAKLHQITGGNPGALQKLASGGFI